MASGVNCVTVERPARNRVLVRVSWTDPDSKSLVTVHVSESISPSDMPEPGMPAPDHVTLNAFKDAQRVATAFAQLPSIPRGPSSSVADGGGSDSNKGDFAGREYRA